MTGLRLEVSGGTALIEARLMDLSGLKFGGVMARAINHTLARTETQVNRAIAKQSGLKYTTVKAAMKRYSASPAKLEGEIKGTGSYMPLSQFGARQAQAGVSAAPWGVRRVFAQTFIIARFRGDVFKRTGSARFPIRKLYGPAIPKEMVQKDAAKAFEQTVRSALPKRVQHELARLLAP